MEVKGEVREAGAVGGKGEGKDVDSSLILDKGTNT